MSNARFFRPDFIVAILALVIGISTMGVYIYQANIMSKQMHAAAWPYVEANISTSPGRFSISIDNKGVGPAIVKKVTIVADTLRFSDSQKNLDSLAHILTGTHDLLSSYTNLAGRVLSPDDLITYIEVSDSIKVHALLQALRKRKLQLEICYCSVFDDCWLLAQEKLEECDSCK
jgi:hypothetical protein